MAAAKKDSARKLRRLTSLLGKSPASAREFEEFTMERLAEACRAIGLTGFSRLRKNELVQHLHEGVQQLRSATEDERPERAAAERRDPPARSDRRRTPEPKPEPEPPAEIPSSYDVCRVAALAVDPNRLFVWWEAAEEKIVEVAESLGDAGTLVLRIYDTTGRLFDGGNAHSSFDQEVPHRHGQWFFDIGRAGSQAFVDLGLRAADGRFLRITRSRRVDFPRDAPAPNRSVQWARVTVEHRQPVTAPLIEAERHQPTPRNALHVAPVAAPLTLGTGNGLSRQDRHSSEGQRRGDDEVTRRSGAARSTRGGRTGLDRGGASEHMLPSSEANIRW